MKRKVVSHEAIDLIVVCTEVQPFSANYGVQQGSEQGKCTPRGNTTPTHHDNRTEVFHGDGAKRHKQGGPIIILETIRRAPNNLFEYVLGVLNRGNGQG